MEQQVAAAGDAQVVYFVAEEETASALRALIAAENQSDNISAFYYD